MRLWRLFGLLLSLPIACAAADSQAVVNKPRHNYRPGDSVPVECLNRTETGEHVADVQGNLQYIPFVKCNETGQPLSFVFGRDHDINCTIILHDELFHQFEFYVHNDAPLTCRVPTGGQVSEYTPFQVGLTGLLQKSHLHVYSRLNVILHTAGSEILAAAAYSLPAPDPPRIFVEDPLILQMSVRWFAERNLPASTGAGLGGHVHWSTFLYSLLSFTGGAAVSFAYFRGVELPRRMRRYGIERLGLGEARSGYAFPGKRE